MLVKKILGEYKTEHMTVLCQYKIVTDMTGAWRHLLWSQEAVILR